jgi:hypothetical protein
VIKKAKNFEILAKASVKILEGKKKKKNIFGLYILLKLLNNNNK